jgi:hypothetical protein
MPRLHNSRKISKSLSKHMRMLSSITKLLTYNLPRKRLSSRIREKPMAFSSKMRRRNGKFSKVSMNTKLLPFKLRSLRVMIRLRILRMKKVILL